MKATKFMREPTQCPISQWVDSEIAKHSKPTTFGDECVAKVALAILKRVKSKLSKPIKDPLAFTKDPRCQSMNSAKFASDDWRCSVLWAGQWVNSSGKSFEECIVKIGRLLK